MSIYVISYDLNSPGQNYEKLYDAIISYGTYFHALDSTWLIESKASSLDIANHLKRYMDSNDKLIVAEITTNTAWVGFTGKGSEWLKDVVGRARH